MVKTYLSKVIITNVKKLSNKNINNKVADKIKNKNRLER